MCCDKTAKDMKDAINMINIRMSSNKLLSLSMKENYNRFTEYRLVWSPPRNKNNTQFTNNVTG